MHTENDYVVAGIPSSVPDVDARICSSRLLDAINGISGDSDDANIVLMVGTKRGISSLISGSKSAKKDASGSKSDGEAQRYEPRLPFYTFEQLVVPQSVLQELTSAVDLLNVEHTVFDTWGLRKIEPFPRTALNFHGAPGTGKTLAAHALANRLNRKILVASYAEIESKYHGDGPKNVKALFGAAEKSNSCLFIDEADSLLSKRLTNVTQGSEQAINSMRSQLLICLEQFSGLVIFSTNLVENYDKAFETRVRHIKFDLPDEPCREKIWKLHVVPQLPVAGDLDFARIAREADDICGRDIKNAVIDTAVRAAISRDLPIKTNDFLAAIDRIKKARIKKARPMTDEEKEQIKHSFKRSSGTDEEAPFNAALPPTTT